MSKAHLESLDIEFDLPEIEGRYAEIGPLTVGLETYKQDWDPAALFTGLPNDRCQAPHWGYVVKGSLTYVFADHSETFEAGDVYYVGPDHLPMMHAGGQVIEFSNTEEVAPTFAVVEANLTAMSQE